MRLMSDDMLEWRIDSPMVMRISVDPGSESAVSTEPRIIAGSAVFKKDDRAAAIRAIKDAGQLGLAKRA